MQLCKICGSEIPKKIIIDGVEERVSNKRVHCFQCCPLGKRIHKPKNKCIVCSKEVNKGGHKFCSATCQQNYIYQKYIERWKQGLETGIIGEYGISGYIKRYLREKYSNQCCKCGWHEVNETTGKVPLEVHHVDGDYTNNNENNLELLCPNCHSLTPTYKNGNASKGRKNRQKYSLYNKNKID